MQWCTFHLSEKRFLYMLFSKNDYKVLPKKTNNSFIHIFVKRSYLKHIRTNKKINCLHVGYNNIFRTAAFCLQTLHIGLSLKQKAIKSVLINRGKFIQTDCWLMKTEYFTFITQSHKICKRKWIINKFEFYLCFLTRKNGV